MTIHRLNTYKDGHIWITYCVHCGKEADELLGSKCTGKVEPSLIHAEPVYNPLPNKLNGGHVKNAVDKPSIDDYVARLIADNGN